MTLLAPTIEDASVDHREDVTAIRSVIADVEAGFNTKDPDLSVAHFAENASSVNVVGVQLTGREALLEANRAGLAGFLSDQFARYEVADITFLRPDVAVAHKHAWATTPDGELLDVGHAMIALYVLVKEDHRWWITARQNTLVPAADDAPG
jgi:uncharacterized protein (TIGR02246 family)